MATVCPMCEIQHARVMEKYVDMDMKTYYVFL